VNNINLRKKGNKFERIAKEYFRKLNYKIIDLNWYCHWGEIDLILEDNYDLVFAEVKYRSRDIFDINEVFTYKKKISLKRSIFNYLKENEDQDKNWRLDLFYITISSGDKSKLNFRHFKNILL